MLPCEWFDEKIFFHNQMNQLIQNYIYKKFSSINLVTTKYMPICRKIYVNI